MASSTEMDPSDRLVDPALGGGAMYVLAPHLLLDLLLRPLTRRLRFYRLLAWTSRPMRFAGCSYRYVAAVLGLALWRQQND